ncbi:MAG: extracellular solute-binding protein [Clostridia bacterium]|nr:extracellular solute-binding protein [Clostridia bacterium]
MKKHFIRNLCLLLATVLLVSCFAACKSDKKEKKEDETDIFVTPKPSPEELGGIVTLSTYRTAPNDTSAFMFIQEYVLQYPGVEVYNDNEYTYDEYFATLDERVENGTIGDVFLVDSDRLAKYVEKGYVVNLSPYCRNLVEFTSGNFKKLYPDTDFFRAAYEDALYENRLYMIPTEYENKAVLINLDLFEKNGLKMPSDKWTWDDVLENAKLLKEAGVAAPVVMDYTDFSVWGAFALGGGGELFKVADEKTGETRLNLTDPKVSSGLKMLAEDFIAAGLLSEKTPGELTEEELRQSAMVVISHSDLRHWEETLKDENFAWEFAHFPRFSSGDEKDPYNHNIGVKTLGFAIRVREYDPEDYTEADILMEDQIRVQLALYALVPEAAVALAGTTGYRVPALISANQKRFWREYPLPGKNTSVFSLYNTADFSATLEAHMISTAAAELTESVGEVIKQYAADPDNGSLDDLLQKIQDNVNANW